MKYKDLSNEDKIDIIEYYKKDDITKAEAVELISDMYDISKRTVYDWVDKIQLENMGYNVDNTNQSENEKEISIVSDESKKIYKLEEENKSLKKALNEAKNHVNINDEIKNIVNNVSNVIKPLGKIPDWVDKKGSTKIVPVICIADVHIGETVNPEDVNYVNEYNTDIALFRVNKCVDDFIDIYINKFDKYEYDGVVCNVMGDIITGELHDLKEENDNTSVDQVIIAVQMLETQIRKLHKAFGKVMVNMVSGNHGRSQPMKYTKLANRYNNSLEKIVYSFVESNLVDIADDVYINTSPEDTLRVSINGHKFKIIHGDTIKTSGTSIAGPSTSFARAYLKQASVGASTNSTFSTLLIGHFHHSYFAQGVMVANSPKGYDTYCAMLGIPYSLPGCTTFAVNTHGQIIFFTDLQIRNEEITSKHPKKSIELF